MQKTGAETIDSGLRPLSDPNVLDSPSAWTTAKRY
jgi:hypothetical protein